MLITAWAITAVILPFAVFQLVYLWPNQSVRLLSVARSLSLLWAIQELWEAQHWYQVAVAWQAAYRRDIGQVRQGCSQRSVQFQHLQAPESGDAALNSSHSGVLQCAASVDREYLALSFSPEQRGCTKSRNIFLFAIETENRPFPAVLRPLLADIPQSDRVPCAQSSLSERDLKYHTQTAATPFDWCW
jgi:hypothetical protein